MKKLFFYISLIVGILIIIQQTAYAQPNRIQHIDRLGDTLILKDIAEKPEILKRTPYKKYDFSIGPILYSDGYGLILTFGKAGGFEKFGSRNEEKYYNTHAIQIELAERKHPKEYSAYNLTNLVNSLSNGISPYTYGKQNHLLMAKVGYVHRRLLGGRGEKNSPLIQYFGGAGLTIGAVKPYYITSMGGQTVKYDSTTATIFLNKDAITGSGGFSKGLNEISWNFGLNLKAGIHLDFATKSKRISALEVGTSVDIFKDPVAQMALIDPKSIFFNVYLNYQFGKRW